MDSATHEVAIRTLYRNFRGLVQQTENAFFLIPRGTMEARGDTVKKRPGFKHRTTCPHVQLQKSQVAHNCDCGSEMLWNKI